jgi:hypothetical protein
MPRVTKKLCVTPPQNWRQFYFYARVYTDSPIDYQYNWCVAGVVVSCKIPILATRVRFPGDATIFVSMDPFVEHIWGLVTFYQHLPAWPNG